MDAKLEEILKQLNAKELAAKEYPFGTTGLVRRADAESLLWDLHRAWLIYYHTANINTENY